jgi:uncharacterized protein (DUF2336 family)
MTTMQSPLTQTLAHDIAATLQASPGRSNEAVQRIADLFVRDCPRYASEHLAVFDDVLGLLIARIEEQARAELADRLADLPQVPPRVLRTLAHDEIAVARPLLTRSALLSDDDLIDVAVARGQGHMTAIAARRGLSAAVTDVLVERGDRGVLHGVASNHTAAFSPFGFGTLVTRSKDDDALQLVVGNRPDLPIDHLKELVRQAKDVVRNRLQATVDRRSLGLIEGALDAGARRVTAETLAAMAEFPSVPEGDALRRFEAGELDEEAVLAYAHDGLPVDVTVALALLAKLPMRLAERIFTEMQDDLLLLVARALGFKWQTVAAMRTLKARSTNKPANLAQLQANFDNLSPQTAQRVLRFLHARDSLSPEKKEAARPTGAAAAERAFL